ncbi:hypothetical protein OEZ85_014287 [Tetradesmus obliquus]|uniref:Uncharacterized protein n=1 Tax=Tetradesmus obliquus TaxID=3088 RepID=A0ABY8U7L0_TETOB|nr:hypothetical protein OEZ85_014287 [Tetradesmus obliquus]
MSLVPVKVPRELLAVQQTVLEEYVRSRLLQFIRGMGTRILQLAPELPPALVDRAVRDVLEVLPQPDYGQVSVEMLELQLVFRHDCLALGCNEPQCVLCQHNSQRRCSVNFAKKYLVNDTMVARCGAGIRVEVVDRASGKVYNGDLPDVCLELFVLDGAQYDQRFLGEAGRALLASGGEEADAQLEACTLLTNNKAAPLITSTAGCRADAQGRLLLQTQAGRVVLPDVTVTDSSEALLSGRKPPFRLVARAKHSDGRRLRIRHAVSEPFVVATRRVRASHKVEIPGMDDAVSKLDHMGRETVRKLGDLAAAAAQAGINLGLEPELTRIEKVGEFKALALRADADGHLRQQLQALLKLPKDKWEEAAEHAKRAVLPDNRMRAWYADPSTLELGLLFPCRLGLVDLKRPEALLQRAVDAAGNFKVEVVTQLRQNPLQRDVVRQLLPQAEASWWAPGHVGWTIFPADTDNFEVSSRLAGIPAFDLHAICSAADVTPRFSTAGFAAPDMQLQAMMQSRSLTEGMIAAITAAYEANQCPSDILDVLQTHIAEDPTAAAGTATGGAGTARATEVATSEQDHDTDSTSSSSGGSSSAGRASPVAGLKRRHSAAVERYSHSSGGDCMGENDVAAPGAAAAAAAAAATSPFSTSGASRAALRANKQQQQQRARGSDASAPPGAKRPASFSGAINMHRGGMAAAAAAGVIPDADVSCQEAGQAAVTSRRPASFSDAHTRSLLQCVRELPERRLAAAAAAAAAAAELEEPHPFYQQLKRDSRQGAAGGSLARAGSNAAAALHPAPSVEMMEGLSMGLDTLPSMDAAAERDNMQRGGTPAAAAAAAKGGAGGLAGGGSGLGAAAGVNVSMDVGPFLDEVEAADELRQA